MDVGRQLRQARERRRMSLRQIAEATKLSETALTHIERNEFHRLPGGIFRRAYLRGYAREVGVDPDAVVAAYLAEFPDLREADAWLMTPPPASDGATPARWLTTATVVTVLGLILYGVFRAATPAPVPPSIDPPETTALLD
jgi:cytoskeleton protein RodZ